MSKKDHDHCHDHEHKHDHDHVHHEHSPAHIHSHRNIIGFDEHGIPTVILKASHGEGEQDDPQAFIKDYMNAVSEYRKTFPTKQDVIEQTPDPAVREMIPVSFENETEATISPDLTLLSAPADSQNTPASTGTPLTVSRLLP